MKRRSLLALIMAMLLVFSAFAGCQDSGNSSQESSATQEQSAATDSSADSAESAGEDSVEAEPRQSVSIMSITFNGNPVGDDNERVLALEEYTNYDIEFTWVLMMRIRPTRSIL